MGTSALDYCKVKLEQISLLKMNFSDSELYDLGLSVKMIAMVTVT